MNKSFIWAIILIVAVTALICISLPGGSEPGQTSQAMGFSSSDYEPMNGFIERFNKLLSEEPIDKLTPVTEISAQDLSWLFKDGDGADPIESKGLLFANGDILIIFNTKSYKDLKQNIISEVMKNPDFKGKNKVISVEGDIGYIIGSKDYSEILKEMAEAARQS